MAGWLKGVVKEVLSGDSISIIGGAKPGQVPAEKRITLSSLVCPKLVRGPGGAAGGWCCRQGRDAAAGGCPSLIIPPSDRRASEMGVMSLSLGSLGSI
jgi:hypothetical protein